MNKLFLSLFCLSCFVNVFAQTKEVKQINSIVSPDVALKPLHYLASDELKGRGTKRAEIHVAAKYIADYFKEAGVKQNDSAKDFYQTFDLKITTPASEGSLKINDSIFQVSKDILQIGGADVTLNARIVYANFGNEKDLVNLDVKDAIVISNLGTGDSSSVQKGFANMQSKQMLLKEKGAVALIERVWQKDAPCVAIQNMFGEERFVQREFTMPVFLLKNSDSNFITSLNNSPQAELSATGNSTKMLEAKNVIGWVPGTDPKLKHEFIVLSAHYDHLGVTKKPQTVDGKTDSIYNGARDNAIGVTAVMNAARYFAKQPAKRSILFVLFTGEEMGLLGSSYFTAHPVVEMNKIVYNLNCDNGGYNDTTRVAIIGLGRTSGDDDLKKACSAYGIQATPDPVPQLNLFDRSDNLNFAVQGVPAPTFSMGVTAFDSTIMKYYHQTGDEVESFNLDYGLKYIRSYILAAKNIANNPLQPKWIKGDKYEAAWNRLYRSAK